MSSGNTSIIKKGQAVPTKGSSGSWSCFLLLKRMYLVIVADRMNLILLIGQPVLIALLISFVVTREGSITKKLFLANIAVMWMACSSGAQVIVRERTIVFRERLAGLRLRSYVLSKFIGMGLISTVQAWLLLGLLWITPNGLIGNPWWQFLAFTGTSLALTGIGILISASCKSATQAALGVPLVIIPLILFSGYVFPLEEWKKKPVVALISWQCPSYAAQRLVDISLLWNRTIDSSEFAKLNLNSTHYTNLQLAVVPLSVWFSGESKLQEIQPEVMAEVYAADPPSEEPPRPLTYEWPISQPKLEQGRVYRHWAAARQPLLLLAAWIAACYAASCLVLRGIKND